MTSQNLLPTGEPCPRRISVWGGAFLLFVMVYCGSSFLCRDLGVTWDEVPYRNSQQNMYTWFEAVVEAEDREQWRNLFSAEVIVGGNRPPAWNYNRFGQNFHPPLAGIFGNLSYAIFHKKVGDLESRRMASTFLFALTTAAVFIFVTSRYGYWPGVIAAGSLVVMPRVFGHALLAGTDMPAMAFWVFVAFAFWNGLESWWWRVAFGVLLGFGFLVKFSAVLVIIPLVLYLLLCQAPREFNGQRFSGLIIGTLMVGAPLVIAGIEVHRLNNDIRHVSQARMLEGASRQVLGEALPLVIGEEVELSDEGLARAAGLLKSKMPTDRPESLDELTWQRSLERLNLDKFIGYVFLSDLGVKTRIPGWILFLPAAIWLCWTTLTRAGPLKAFQSPGIDIWLAGLSLAPLVAVIFNPTWWHNTLEMLAHYEQISVGRQGALPDIEIFYLGKKYVYSLPWHNGWVLLAVTVPTSVLLLSLAGLLASCSRIVAEPVRVFFFFNLITLPISRMFNTPAHDGVRLMLPAFVFLACFAGLGFELIVRFVHRFRDEEYSPSRIYAIIAGFLIAPPLFFLMKSHPYELSYYNSLVGGLRLAHEVGFEPTYWYDAVSRDVLDELNDTDEGLPVGAVLSLPEPASIVESVAPSLAGSKFVQSLPAVRINTQALEEAQLIKWLRYDINLAGQESDSFPYVALLTHSSKASPFTRLLYSLKPRWEVRHEDVRLFSVYEPKTVAAAWALWLLLDDSDYSPVPLVPSSHNETLRIAANNGIGLLSAAVRIQSVGLDQSLEQETDPDARRVLDRLTQRRAALQFLLTRDSSVLEFASEIIIHQETERPGLLKRIIEYDGYLHDSELKSYLDSRL